MDGANTPAAPAGDYAIVELLGHRTLIGRVTEVERFGGKLLGVEVLFNGQLLPQTLHTAATLYAFTPIDAATALRRQATETWQLPQALREAAPPVLLAPPQGEFGFGAHAAPDEDDEPEGDFNGGFDADHGARIGDCA